MNVLIIEDHIAVRRGLQLMLTEEYPDANVSGVGDAKAAGDMLRSQSWDLVLCDINMPGRNGIEVLKEIRCTQPKLPVLVVSMHPEEEFAVRALRAGASGYLTKKSEPEEMMLAVRTVLAGRRYVSASLADQLARSLSDPADKQPHERLSDREYEVFRLLASGKEVKEAAAELGLSVKTISTHREHILQKMRMKNNAAMTVYAVRNGLME